MVQHPVVSLLVREDFAVVSGAVEVVALFRADDRCGVSLFHGASLAVGELSVQRAAASHLNLIRLVPIVSRADKHVPVALAVMPISALEHPSALRVLTSVNACHHFVSCTVCKLRAELAQLNAMDAAHAAEEEPNLSRCGVGNHLGVNGVVNARLLSACDYAHILKLAWRCRFAQSHNAGVLQRVVEGEVGHASSVHHRHVRSPYMPTDAAKLLHDAAVQRNDVREAPVYKVIAAQQRPSCVLSRAKAIELAIGSLPNGGVGPVLGVNGVFIRIVLCQKGGCRKQQSSK